MDIYDIPGQAPPRSPISPLLFSEDTTFPQSPTPFSASLAIDQKLSKDVPIAAHTVQTSQPQLHRMQDELRPQTTQQAATLSLPQPGGSSNEFASSSLTLTSQTANNFDFSPHPDQFKAYMRSLSALRARQRELTDQTDEFTRAPLFVGFHSTNQSDDLDQNDENATGTVQSISTVVFSEDFEKVAEHKKYRKSKVESLQSTSSSKVASLHRGGSSRKVAFSPKVASQVRSQSLPPAVRNSSRGGSSEGDNSEGDSLEGDDFRPQPRPTMVSSTGLQPGVQETTVLETGNQSRKRRRSLTPDPSALEGRKQPYGDSRQ